MDIKRILISRTDSIGDVILTLPMAGILKQLYPDCIIIFLGRSYTRDIIEACSNVDRFVDWDEISGQDRCTKAEIFHSIKADAIIHVFPRKEIAFSAWRAKIPVRIGSTGRIYHYPFCNRLVPLSRKNSDLHESQLNLKLLKPLGGQKKYELSDISPHYGLNKIDPLPEKISGLISKNKFNLIVHPKSKGSAREWGNRNYKTLLEILPQDLFEIFITGTKDDGEQIKDLIQNNQAHVHDLTGKISLKELISFTSAADGLLAASTGPLHIAAALGKFALGLYPPIRPMHPGRWAPVGENAHYLVKDKNCSVCRKLQECECLESITPKEVKNKLISFTYA
ncbi:MAG: glycosyltransferase family 9 protein [Bacteroidales bacterium]|nr:glycosyltransferase family 9 protein [Bacteroidales bacterium]MCF8403497.1 glycosyltransferase family 9 protein [Bacteroidales bacterium]